MDLTDKYIHWQWHGENNNWGQGHVIGNVANPGSEPVWVVQCFSWLTGCPTYKVMLTNAELLDGEVRIYDSQENWNFWADKLLDKKGETLKD